MKLSLLCPACHNYASVPSDWKGQTILTISCGCGAILRQPVCPACRGTGWQGMERCSCELGLLDQPVVVWTPAPSPEKPVFGQVVDRNRDLIG
jgi:hypothetical protein